MKSLYLALLMFTNIFLVTNLSSQNIRISNTIKNNSNLNPSITKINFSVTGNIVGLDSGQAKVTADDGITSIPIKNGKFSFTGFVQKPEQVHMRIDGDYYTNAFYIEEGNIKIAYTYQKNFSATGTKENDLISYFFDSINYKTSQRFFDLSNRINIATKDADIDQYLNLVDSFLIAEKQFFKNVDTMINQNKLGYYLLAAVNYYAINYSYFKERRSIYSHIPDSIKNSKAGVETLNFLNASETKSNYLINTKAISFNLKDSNGRLISLDRFKGKTIVLDYWASWCAPCIASLPILKKIQLNPISKDVIFISISIDKKENEWKVKDKSLKIPWLSVIADSSVIKNYNINTVPAYIIINKEGNIINNSSSVGDIYVKLKKYEN